jgi:hypothetical protein
MAAGHYTRNCSPRWVIATEAVVVMGTRQWWLVTIPAPGIDEVFIIVKPMVRALVFVSVLKLFLQLINLFVFYSSHQQCT